ncbi:MAG: hypothetical protein ACRBCS_03180 [Cellvibrionaceae bacterium]
MIILTEPLHVKRYISHPEIFNAISTSVSFEEFTPTIGPEDYFIVTAPESMFYLHPFCEDVWQIHAHVHPDYRKHAVDAAHLALEFAFSELEALKVVCLIPEIFPRVRGFARKCGLTDHGFIPDSYRKNSETSGQWLLGLSRKEFEGH